jgi:hypothetical protein
MYSVIKKGSAINKNLSYYTKKRKIDFKLTL